jgi:hypothetical protein
VSVARLVAAIRARAAEIVQTWAPGARGAWCRSQRRLLQASDGAVVWVRGPTLPWALWGARRGYFAVERMDGIAYLRLAGPAPSPV